MALFLSPLLTLGFHSHVSSERVQVLQFLTVSRCYCTGALSIWRWGMGQEEHSIILWLNLSLSAGLCPWTSVWWVPLTFSLHSEGGGYTSGGWSGRDVLPTGSVRVGDESLPPERRSSLGRTLPLYLTTVTPPLPLAELWGALSQLFTVRTLWVSGGETHRSVRGPLRLQPQGDSHSQDSPHSSNSNSSKSPFKCCRYVTSNFTSSNKYGDTVI